ncbi:hypothetical protein FD754_025070 [Muntiacus muntjak]|uniref:NAD(P)(+)--arginine ADP-ribosyltransferase n=1 Tax=Muntiacus muntjak TaxID=9888 RepID=A0A5N3ULV3_MUNMU|nr:hypothetical protein FD754_025071 [Muntiacus muntjak]KAB0337644.1 hypothetical protein FD754_025070 [Muntiacus muntjak]
MTLLQPLPDHGLTSSSLPPQGITSQYMDLAPNTFDDAYVGCSEKMEKVAVNLLKEEMARHTRLRGAWETAEKYWEQKSPGLSLPPGFKREHGIAIVLYTNSSNTLYRELNQAVRTGGRSWESYMNQFPFKALHFYLTRALQLLRGSGGCSSKPGLVVFRGVPNVLLEPRRLWDAVRLGQFASSTLDEAVAHKVYPNTIFFLRTCFGALIQDFSVFPEEREVLIPPQEIFLVTQFDQSKDQNWVTLSSSDHICSYFNCAYLGEKKMQTCVRLLSESPSCPSLGGQADSLSNGPFSLFSWKTLLLASWGFQHLGAGL